MEQPDRWGYSSADVYCDAFNFGPALENNRTVQELVEEVLKHCDGEWLDQSEANAPHEASKLNLATDKAFHLLQWKPTWDFGKSIARTVEWYAAEQLEPPSGITLRQIEEFEAANSALNYARTSR